MLHMWRAGNSFQDYFVFSFQHGLWEGDSVWEVYTAMGSGKETLLTDLNSHGPLPVKSGQ